MHTLEESRFELPDIDDWYAGDSRVLSFSVVRNGVAVDLSTATISWALYGRAYQDSADAALLSDGDSGVEVVTDDRVDVENGEFEVRIDAAATEGLWGEYWHRPEIQQQDGTVAQWRGEVVLTA